MTPRTAGEPTSTRHWGGQTQAKPCMLYKHGHVPDRVFTAIGLFPKHRWTLCTSKRWAHSQVLMGRGTSSWRIREATMSQALPSSSIQSSRRPQRLKVKQMQVSSTAPRQEEIEPHNFAEPTRLRLSQVAGARHNMLTDSAYRLGAERH